MSGRSLRRVGPVLSLSLLLGCASPEAPTRWQRSMETVATSSLGTWTKVTFAGGATIEGELLAIDGQRLTLLDHPRLYQVTLGCAQRIRAEPFDASGSDAIIASVLGGLSTFTHGYFLVFSLPVWLAVGGLSIRSARQQGDLTFGADEWKRQESSLDEIAAWSRFPQGLPADYAAHFKERIVWDYSCRPTPAP